MGIKEFLEESKISKFFFMVPIFICIVGIVTIIICIILTKTRSDQKILTGGLPIPYISDTGKVAPMYGIFVGGECTVTVFWIIFVVLLCFHFEKIMQEKQSSEDNKHQRNLRYASVFFGAFGVIFLAGLTIFDTADFPDVHLTCAIIFFVFEIVFFHLQTVFFGMNGYLKYSFRVKLAIQILMDIFFIIYLPIGLPLANYTYDPKTKTYDYTVDISTNMMRVVCQYGTVFSLMIYFCTFSYDIYRIRNKPVEE